MSVSSGRLQPRAAQSYSPCSTRQASQVRGTVQDIEFLEPPQAAIECSQGSHPSSRGHDGHHRGLCNTETQRAGVTQWLHPTVALSRDLLIHKAWHHQVCLGTGFFLSDFYWNISYHLFYKGEQVQKQWQFLHRRLTLVSIVFNIDVWYETNKNALIQTKRDNKREKKYQLKKQELKRNLTAQSEDILSTRITIIG